MSELKEPVITIDGASGTGKGTISQIIAKRLKWRLLDSGALYRAFALAAQKHNIFPHNEEELELFAEPLTILAEHFDVQFIAQGSISDPPRIILEGEDVTDKIRIKKGIGNAASIVSAISSVRLALLSRQRAFREEPGLVADGRDMGTVIFPDAELKIFLTASPEERAIRRYNQLKERGINATLSDLIKELRERDRRDKERAVAPLKPAEDAICIDTDRLSIEQVVERIVSEISKKKAFPVTSYITKFAEVGVAE